MSTVFEETLESPDGEGGQQQAKQDAAPSASLWVAWSPDTDQIGRQLQPRPGQPLVLGRGATVTIDDPWLSSEHLQVACAKAGLWVVDLETRNGSFLNRRHRLEQEAPLQLGDVLRCGATLLVFEPGAPCDDERIVGWSSSLEAARAALCNEAGSGHPVHLTGESGVGKEVLAQELHRRSGRSGELVAVNMAAIAATLAEDQLFGHARGAFTGADSATPGLFGQADGGTLLLDEIGDCPAPLQSKLLRALETAEIFPLGSAEPRRVDVRLVTATLHDLQQLVVQGRFREDLYWRLVHSTIRLDPLRARRIDVVPLVTHFLRHDEALAPTVEGRKARWALCSLLEALLVHDWPGNVRQLRAETHRLARALRAGVELPSPEACFSEVITAPPRVVDGDDQGTLTPEVCRDWLEDPDALLEAVLTHAEGNLSAFARMIAPALNRRPDSLRRTLYRRLGDERLARLRG